MVRRRRSLLPDGRNFSDAADFNVERLTVRQTTRDW
jgi:hypothetical protein